MPRKKRTTNNPRTHKRLKTGEQVRDRKKAVGFGAGTGKTVYQPRTTRTISALRELILTTVWAETCIETIVDEVIKHPLYTDNPPDGKIEAFLKYPSDREPLFLIRKMYLKDMLRWGNGAVIVRKEGGKEPKGLVAVPGYTLRVTSDEPVTYRFAQMTAGGDVSSSEFKTDKSDNLIELPSDQVMHFQINAESDSTLANSPLERAFDDISSDKEMQQKLLQHVQKGFYKPSFINFKKGSSVNKGEIEEFVEYLNGLVEEGAKILGVNKEIGFDEIPYWSAEDIVKMQQWIGLKVAATFKVPPFMVNLVNDVGSLNAREQKARFLENVVMPILEYESFLYTMVICRQGFENTETEITSNILGTKLNWNRARIAKLLTSPNQEILTTNEIRSLFFNLPPVDGGDVLRDTQGNPIGEVQDEETVEDTEEDS